MRKVLYSEAFEKINLQAIKESFGLEVLEVRDDFIKIHGASEGLVYKMLKNMGATYYKAGVKLCKEYKNNPSKTDFKPERTTFTKNSSNKKYLKKPCGNCTNKNTHKFIEIITKIIDDKGLETAQIRRLTGLPKHTLQEVARGRMNATDELINTIENIYNNSINIEEACKIVYKAIKFKDKDDIFKLNITLAQKYYTLIIIDNLRNCNIRTMRHIERSIEALKNKGIISSNFTLNLLK